MDAKRFETDELTGLFKWPVLLNGDWSQWTDEPCAVLFGETRGWENDGELQRKVGELLRSPHWSHLTAFWLGHGGFLVLAPSCSLAQALPLAQEINRTLEADLFAQTSWQMPSSEDAALTWGVTFAPKPGWDLPRTLQTTIALVQHAIREKRWGSINTTPSGPAHQNGAIFWVCSRHDPLTELKLWTCTAALCSHYADEAVALLLGNVDRLRDCPNSCGFGASDIVLQMIAHVLRRFESSDVASFRSGGDEFAVWVRGQSLERARQLAEQINAQVRALQIPMSDSPESVSNISLTWGVVGGAARHIELPHVLLKARDLLDDAKTKQRGSVKAQRL